MPHFKMRHFFFSSNSLRNSIRSYELKLFIKILAQIKKIKLSLHSVSGNSIEKLVQKKRKKSQ
jgi:hypothetical protein